MISHTDEAQLIPASIELLIVAPLQASIQDRINLCFYNVHAAQVEPIQYRSLCVPSYKHMYIPPFRNMNAHSAAQILSHSVASGIKMLIKKGRNASRSRTHR